MIITKTLRPLLEEIFYLGARSSILVFKNVGKLLKQYDESDKQNRIAILKRIAKTYHPQEENFPSQIQKMTSSNFIQTCENIHSYTEPKYAELFRLIGRQPDGVHSLVHL
ncbi:unnamed protein product, partial [Rotaria magnacalcarata]